MSSNLITITDPNTNITYEYALDARLRKNIDEKVTPALHKQDNDYVMIIDGEEGSGKSTFAFQIGRYVDNSLSLHKVCIDTDEFRKAIVNAKKGDCIIFDEAYRGFGASGALSEVNKVLKSMVMEMRQKNLFVIIVLPTFYELDRYVAIHRAKVLIHITKRGYFRVYNKQKKIMLYQNANNKRFYRYSVKTYFRGRFYGKTVIDEQAYREKKLKAFKGQYKKTRNEKYMEQRNRIIKAFKEEFDLSLKDLVELFERYKIPLKKTQTSDILSKMG